MGKHTNSRAVDRGGLIRRYAAARGMDPVRVEKMFRNESRSDLRDLVEVVEREEGLAVAIGSRSRAGSGRLAVLEGQTTAVFGVTR